MWGQDALTTLSRYLFGPSNATQFPQQLYKAKKSLRDVNAEQRDALMEKAKENANSAPVDASKKALSEFVENSARRRVAHDCRVRLQDGRALREFLRKRKVPEVAIRKRVPTGLLKQFWEQRFKRTIRHKDKMYIRRSADLALAGKGDECPRAKRVPSDVALGRKTNSPSIQHQLFKRLLRIRGTVKGRLPFKTMHAEATRLLRVYFRECAIACIQPAPPRSQRRMVCPLPPIIPHQFTATE